MNRKFFFLLFLLSFIQLALEVVLFQTAEFLYDYHASIFFLGMVMTAIGAGGALAYATPQWVEKYNPVLLLSFPFSTILTLFWITQLAYLKFLCLALIALPFFFNSILIAPFFFHHPPHRVYAVLMFGAAAGLVFSFFAIPSIREENTLLAVSVLAASLTLFSPVESSSWRKAIRLLGLLFLIVTGAFLTENIRHDRFNFALDIRQADPRYSQKVYAQSLRRKDLIASKGNLIARIDAFGFGGEKAVQARIAYSGNFNDHITPFPPENFWFDRRLPHGLLHDPRVLILGTAAEGITKSAKGLGQGLVTGVEINPAIVDLMKGKLWERSRRAYEGIQLHTMNARAFLNQTKERFDVITLINTHHVKDIGSVGRPEYLHSREAFRAYFEHLSEQSFLVLEERNENQRGDLGILKIVRTAMTALEEMGIPNPQHHIVVYNYYHPAFYSSVKYRRHLYTILLFHRSPLSEKEINFYLTWAGEVNYRARGGINFEKNNLLSFSYLPHETLDTALEEFILKKGKEWDKTPFDLRAVTDNRPFPFKVYWKEGSILKIVGALGLALLFLILFSSSCMQHALPSEERRRLWKGSFYFILIGLGYMLLEITLLEELQLFLDSPTTVFIIVLGSLFIFNGLSALVLAPRFSSPCSLLWLIATVGISAPLYWFAFPHLSLLGLRLNMGLRMGTAFLFLAPLGLLLGIPFPAGMKIFSHPSFVAAQSLYYGLNGAAFGLGSALALALAMHFGYDSCFWTAGICYLAAGAMLGKRVRIPLPTR